MRKYAVKVDLPKKVKVEAKEAKAPESKKKSPSKSLNMNAKKTLRGIRR